MVCIIYVNWVCSTWWHLYIRFINCHIYFVFRVGLSINCSLIVCQVLIYHIELVFKWEHIVLTSIESRIYILWHMIEFLWVYSKWIVDMLLISVIYKLLTEFCVNSVIFIVFQYRCELYIVFILWWKYYSNLIWPWRVDIDKWLSNVELISNSYNHIFALSNRNIYLIPFDDIVRSVIFCEVYWHCTKGIKHEMSLSINIVKAIPITECTFVYYRHWCCVFCSWLIFILYFKTYQVNLVFVTYSVMYIFFECIYIWHTTNSIFCISVCERVVSIFLVYSIY